MASFELSPEPHPSSVAITSRTKEFLDGSGLTARMTPIEARAASEDEIAMYHTRELHCWYPHTFGAWTSTGTTGNAMG